MFLCPAARRGGETAQAPSLSEVLLAGTRDVHQTSDRLIRRKAPLAFSQKKLWTALLSQFYYVFRELELALAAGSERSPRLHALHAPFFAKLARSDAFLSDVQYHGGPGGLQAPSAATADYVTRIRELAAGDKQLLLLAYAHTLYLALLSGGVLLERMLRGAMLLPRGRGTEVFRFAALPPREQARFKRELRAVVDALGETLGEADRTALLQEKRSIFWRNDRLIIAVFQEARGSLVVAYARLARASIYAVLASPLVLVALLVLLAAVAAGALRLHSADARQ